MSCLIESGLPVTLVVGVDERKQVLADRLSTVFADLEVVSLFLEGGAERFEPSVIGELFCSTML